MVREHRTYLDDHPMYHFSLGDFIRRGRFYICLILGVVFITFVCLVVSLMPSVFNNFLVKYNNKTWCEIISSQWLASWKCPPPWADYPLLLYRPPGITFDVWEQNKKPRSYYASGAVSAF